MTIIPDTKRAGTRLLRFHDLQFRGIVFSRVQLNNLIAKEKFPPGLKLSANTRAWRETDVEEWISSRTTDKIDSRRPSKPATEKMAAV